MIVREVIEADTAACAQIYVPYVTGTVITFELEPPTAQEFVRRIGAAHLWLVAEIEGVVVGYAYAGTWNARAAYRWTVEVSVYLETGRRRTGAGRALYEALLGELAARGYRTAVAGMTLPNDASEALHLALGFTPVGVFERVGWKAGAWHDVVWFERSLGAGGDPPPEPRLG